MTLSYFTDKIPAVVDAALHMIIALILFAIGKKLVKLLLKSSAHSPLPGCGLDSTSVAHGTPLTGMFGAYASGTRYARRFRWYSSRKEPLCHQGWQCRYGERLRRVSRLRAGIRLSKGVPPEALHRRDNLLVC